VEYIKVKTELPVRDRLLEVAQDFFMKHGYVGTKTLHIANAAGTSETSLFRHYESKYSLLTAVYDRAWKKLNRFIDTTLERDDPYEDPREEIIAVLTAFWTFYTHDQPTCALLLINTGNTDSLLVEQRDEVTISEGNVAYLERIEGLCRKASEAGYLTDISPRVASEGLLGLSEGVLLGWYLHDRSPSGKYPDKITITDAQKLLRKLLF
jgi:AcrR family transcriptional regulator